MGFMFCDLHVSLKQPFVEGYKFVKFVLFEVGILNMVYGCILGWWSDTYYFGVTVT